MKKLFTFLTLLLCAVAGVKADVIGYTEAINGPKLDGRVLTGMEKVVISDPIKGSNITDHKGTSKDVYINNTKYTNTDSWRKSQNGTYEGQNVGYKLTIATGYKLNISKVTARIAVADDTYNWYVEILNASGTQVWKSGEKTTKKASSATVDADVSLQGLTGTITVNLYVKQGGSTKYYSINYLQLDAAVEVDNRATYVMTTSLTPEGAGTITPANGTEITEGESAVFTATPNTGYKFVKWTIDGTDYTTNPYTIENVAAAHTAVATFEALPKITFAKDGDDDAVVGTLPGVEYTEAGADFTLPRAYFLTKPGYTLTGWNDGTSTYAVGSKITISGDVTLTAVFTTNAAALGDAATTVTWPFATDNGAPSFKLEQNSGYYVWQVEINDEKIDMPMFIDTRMDAGIVGTYGKVDMQNNRAQVNAGTVFTIPAMTGMTITVTYTKKETPNVSAIKFDGNDADAVDTNKKTITYTYNGAAEAISLVDQTGSLYPSAISVAYPIAATAPIISATPASVSLTVAKGTTSANANFTITGKNLIDGVYTISASKTVEGLSFSPASFTVADGAVNQEVTVTYEATESNEGGELNLTATVGEEGLTVPVTYISKAQGTLLVATSAATTWDWTSWNETVEYKDDDVNIQNVYSDIIDANNLTAPSGFKANQITFKGQYPVRAKKAQNGTWTIKTTVAGTLSVKFSDTGSSGTNPAKRFLNINGKNTKFYTQRTGSSNDQKTVEVYVPAGEINITGRGEDETTNQAICMYTIVFTPVTDIPSTSVAVSDAGYRTFTSSYPLDFTTPVAGLTAYTAKVNGDEVTFEEVNGLVPAGEGLLLKGEAANYNLAVAATMPAAIDNAFKGALLETSVPAGTFVLYNGDKGIGFYKTTAEAFTVGANTAYLPASIAAASRTFIAIDNTVTGISEVNTAEKNSAIYNLNGVRVDKAVKGLYIVNGKKMVVK